MNGTVKIDLQHPKEQKAAAKAKTENITKVKAADMANTNSIFLVGARRCGGPRVGTPASVLGVCYLLPVW